MLGNHSQVEVLALKGMDCFDFFDYLKVWQEGQNKKIKQAQTTKQENL